MRRKRLLRKRMMIAGAGLVFVLAMLLFGVANAKTEKKSAVSDEETEEVHVKAEDVITNGISIAGVDVSGMTAQEAKAALANYKASYDGAEFTLTANDANLTCSEDELGISSNEDEVINQALKFGYKGNLIARFKAKKKVDSGEKKNFPLNYSVNRLAATEFLQNKGSALSIPAKDSTLTRQGGAFKFVEGTTGSVLDVDASVDRIAEFISSEWKGENGTIEMVVSKVEPKGDKEQLSSIKDALGTFSTNYASSPAGRKTNVQNGAAKINGKVLYPGEAFSVAATIGPITEENGYAMATAYENGQTVDSIGGGVCQISSTLYNAVIRAELKVTERSAHSMTVSYVDPSADAAIAGDYKDLKFVNNQKTPVFLEVITNGSTITATVFGKETRPANRKVSFESEIVEQIDPVTSYVAVGDQAIGFYSKTSDSHTGYKAQLLKIVTVDGAEQSRDVYNKSNYKVSNRTVAVGTMSADPAASAAVTAAVATQDKATIDAAIAQYKNAPAPAATPAPAEAAAVPAATDPAAPATPATDAQAAAAAEGLDELPIEGGAQ